ncbi:MULTISPECIES: hypothetical protein [Kitasatospora]|uniref:hypothetical protein n=1 Tax=Kitasatospora TaxID=2063 RepID=UPI00131B86DC|nr:hypothetical protein [Kitasatospora fiedleri]
MRTTPGRAPRLGPLLTRFRYRTRAAAWASLSAVCTRLGAGAGAATGGRRDG